MSDMDWLGPAITNIFALHNLAYLLAAVAVGILVGALPGLLVAVVAGWQLMGVDLQTAILPACAAGMIALLSIGLLIRGWILDSPKKPGKAGSPPLDRLVTRLAIIVAVIYVVLMGVVGFFVTTFAILFSLGLLLAPEGLKRNQIPKILVSAAITCTAFYVVFVIFFNVPLPEGWLY